VDIDIFVAVLYCWHIGEWYIGTRVPAAKHVKVSVSGAEICLRQVAIPLSIVVIDPNKSSQQNHSESRELEVKEPPE